MKNKTKRKIKAAGTVLFLIYILALIYFLFFAERFSGVEFAQREYHYNLTPFQEIRRFWIYKEQLGVFAVVSNLFGNVIGLVPFGLILPIICRNARGFFFITFSGFALSLCVETIQLITKLGCFDVDDMILNTTGAAFGYILFAVSHFIYRKNRRKQHGKETL